MDSESIEAVRAVVTEVLSRSSDRDPWPELAAAGLLALPVPEAYDGEGLGLSETAVLLREAGARAAHAPLWETLCCAVPTLAASGSPEQQVAWLPRVARGEAVLTPALREPGVSLTGTPTTRHADGVLTGRKTGVTYADRADRLLVTAVDGADTVVALVDPHGPGVTLLPTPSSGEPAQHTVVLEAAPAELLAPGAARVLVEHAVAGLAVLAAGLVSGARDLTADYVKGRTQFGRALAEFQAVAMQVADVYITSRTMDLAAANAVWRVAEGLDAADDLAVAAYWVGVAGAGRAAHLPPPARRHGARRDLPAAGVLRLDDRPRARARHAAR